MAIDVNIPSQVKNYANLAAFPATGTLKTIFIAEDTNKTYRWTGSAYVEISAAGATGITIGTTAITSGTVGRVLFEGTGNVVQESANLTYDNTNQRFQVGTSSTSPFGSPLIFMGKDQNGETNFQISNSTSGTGATVGFRVFGANNRSTFLGEFSQGHTGVTEFATNYVIEPNAPNIKHGLIISLPETTTGSDFMIYTGGRNAGNRKLTLFGSTGNLAINTTTDAGYKLDVNGTARVSGVTLIGSSLISTSAYPLQVVGGAGGSALFSNTTRSQALNVNLTTSGETRIYTDYFTGGADQKLILGTFANRANQLVLNTTGNVAIGTTTDAGFKLDVNGTARVQDNVTVQKNQNLLTSIDLTNTTSGANAYTQFSAISDVNSGANSFGKYSTLKTAYKIIQPRDSYYYNGSIAGDFAILNDCSIGQIKFAAGGSSTAHMTIKSNGRINMSALPTSSAGLASGDIWNDAGTLKIV